MVFFVCESNVHECYEENSTTNLHVLTVGPTRRPGAALKLQTAMHSVRTHIYLKAFEWCRRKGHRRTATASTMAFPGRCDTHARTHLCGRTRHPGRYQPMDAKCRASRRPVGDALSSYSPRKRMADADARPRE